MASEQSTRFTFSKQRIEALPVPAAGERAIYYDDPGPSGKGVRGLCLRCTPSSRTFFVQRKFAGRQDRFTLGPFPAVPLDEARPSALAAIAAYARGDSPLAAAKAKRRATTGQSTLGAVWTHYAENRKRRRTDTSSETLALQWRVYFEDWADRPLAELDTDDGREEAEKRIRAVARRQFAGLDKKGQRKNFGGRVQANRVQRMGRAMFNHATRNLRWAGGNPFDFDQTSEAGHERERKPTRDEARRLMGALAQLNNTTAADFFRACIYTGQRAGTIRRMRFADVDFETGAWRVGITKTGRVHAITLPTVALELAEARRKAVAGAFVFPGRKPDTCYAEYKTAWKRVLKLAKIADLRVHDLRHLSATAEHEAGVLERIQARLGHASGAQTAAYVHAAAALERLMADATLASILEAKP